ncbi:MAG: SagB/ThcOx family dehydrogenase, partial [Nitrospinota bacterium]
TEVTYPLIEEIKSLNIYFEELNSHKQINPQKSLLSTKINPLKVITLNVHSERIPRGLDTGLASELNKIKLPTQKIPCGLAAGSFNSDSSSKVNPVRGHSSLTPKDGGIEPPSLRNDLYHRQESVAFNNGVKNFFTMVRSRRSAQAYDKKAEMELNVLSLILKKAFLRPNLDYDLTRSSLIDLYLFVHRIKGLKRGLYLYDESEHQLFSLQNGNIESTARSLSLSQEIASDSSVCFAMIANFSLAFSLLGEIGYRAIHFEAGRIGQALYLGSESLNYNSTGIGAFFDDDVNRFLQLKEGYEVIYHFAMGKAIPDRRIQTLDGYYHLNRPGAGTE